MLVGDVGQRLVRELAALGVVAVARVGLVEAEGAGIRTGLLLHEGTVEFTAGAGVLQAVDPG